jgi:hypothetical protein
MTKSLVERDNGPAQELLAKANDTNSFGNHVTLAITLVPMPDGIGKESDCDVMHGIYDWCNGVAAGSTEMGCLLCDAVIWRNIDPKLSPPPRVFAVVQDVDWRERGHARPTVVTSGLCQACCDRAGNLEQLRQAVLDAYAAMWSDKPAEIYENMHVAGTSVQ